LFKDLSVTTQAIHTHWKQAFAISSSLNVIEMESGGDGLQSVSGDWARPGAKTCSSPPSCGTPTIKSRAGVATVRRPAAAPASRLHHCLVIHTPFAFQPGDDQDHETHSGMSSTTAA
jgi:hypothetical protein